ncbi:hypothetical protein B9Z65_1295 [Elsinoe australis]|uniref:Uncharacterized protein n=1 Tax=Elsinoe australis TaxID=40998 RepID=A0A2P7YQ79_9PEZI|nr:hypothetical protein B9Z65_1295 [Elsinoe australis]
MKEHQQATQGQSATINPAALMMQPQIRPQTPPQQMSGSPGNGGSPGGSPPSTPGANPGYSYSSSEEACDASDTEMPDAPPVPGSSSAPASSLSPPPQPSSTSLSPPPPSSPPQSSSPSLSPPPSSSSSSSTSSPAPPPSTARRPATNNGVRKNCRKPKQPARSQATNQQLLNQATQGTPSSSMAAASSRPPSGAFTSPRRDINPKSTLTTFLSDFLGPGAAQAGRTYGFLAVPHTTIGTPTWCMGQTNSYFFTLQPGQEATGKLYNFALTRDAMAKTLGTPKKGFGLARDKLVDKFWYLQQIHYVYELGEVGDGELVAAMSRVVGMRDKCRAVLDMVLNGAQARGRPGTELETVRSNT